MACWDSGHEFPDPPASTTIQVTMDKIKLTQLSDKYAVNSTTLQSLCDTVYKYLINDSSILITEYPFALRICLLEYFIFKLLQLNSGKIVLLHIPEFIQQLIPTLDVKYSKLFGGVLTHTLDSSKRVFTISYDQYSYVRFELLPKLPRDKMIYFYIGNDMINASLIPGFQNIQNFILTSKLLPSSVCDVSYSFVHFFGEDHNNLHTDVYFSNPNKTKINSDDRNDTQSFPTPIPVPIRVPISAPIAISLDTLIHKYNIPEHTRLLEYLTSTVMDCIERGESIAIERLKKNILTCLLDYITVKRMETIPHLSTIVDYTKCNKKQLKKLEIKSTNGFNDLISSRSSSKRVLFTQLNDSTVHILNTEYQNIILISYTNCGDRFTILNLLLCPFISLSHSKISKGLLAKVTRPFLLITYLKDLNKVECTRRNTFNVSIPKEPQIISFNNIDILPENALPQSANKNVESTTISKKIDQSIDIESLLDRLTNKYNCYLNPSVCSTVYYFIEEGESLIVDNFSKPQLLYIIDFVLAIKTFRKISFSETKTLIYCSNEDFQTKLQVLDVIRSEQYSFVNSDGTFDSNKKVLILNDISQKYCKILKERLKLDKSYLLIHLHKKSQGRFRHSFTHMSCCNVLGLCVDRTELFPKKQTFIHISQGEFDKLEVNDCRNNINKSRGENLNFIKDDKVTDNNKLEDKSPISQNILSIPENITPVINPLFLDKQNPITALIHQLFNKHQIEVLHTDLPTELCNVTFTFLMANRNVCVDGFDFTLISPLLAVFALECVELGIPVKIHFGNYAILPRDKLENIHIIPNEDLIQTLTENNDPMHLWMFIGTDHKLLTQVFPLLKITHQCIFLLSHAVPFIFERSILPITRIYKFLDCVFIRSFNQHNSQSFRDGFNKGNLPNSPRSLNSETPTCAIIPVDILPAISTETQLLTKIVPSNDSTIENSSMKIDNNHEANTDFELSDSCNDLSIEHIEFPEPNQEFVVAIDDACLPENCAESSTEVVLINLTGNHTPDIPITNNLDCNYGINLNIICNNSEENDACIDSDILKLDSELLHKEIVLSEMEEKLSENKEDHNSPIPLEETHIIPDIINAANHVDSDRLSTEQVDENKLFSTEYITKLASEEISELYPVTLPNNTILESNSTQSISPSEPGIQLVTSPLQAGVHTILYSSDSTYYNLIMHHVADVLNCLRNTLQVVITSQNPDICSQLLKLASIHVHSARGFLYKAGSIDSLCNYIIQNELQILSIPLSSLVSLIQTDSSLFLDNHILVYVEDPRINYLDNSMVLGVLTNNIAFQYIFLLPDKKPRFDHFPSPYCEIKFSDFSTKNESYFVEFNFED